MRAALVSSRPARHRLRGITSRTLGGIDNRSISPPTEISDIVGFQNLFLKKLRVDFSIRLAIDKLKTGYKILRKCTSCSVGISLQCLLRRSREGRKSGRREKMHRQQESQSPYRTYYVRSRLSRKFFNMQRRRLFCDNRRARITR